MPKIQCPNCCNCFHETTEAFNPDVQPNGSMVRLLEPWRSWGWCAFGDGSDGRDKEVSETTATLVGDMICPNCEAPLAPSGRLTLVKGDNDFTVIEQPAVLEVTIDRMSSAVANLPKGDPGAFWEVNDPEIKKKVLALLDKRTVHEEIARQTGVSVHWLKTLIPELRKERKEERIGIVKAMLAAQKSRDEMVEATGMSITGVRNMVEEIQNCQGN